MLAQFIRLSSPELGVMDKYLLELINSCTIEAMFSIFPSYTEEIDRSLISTPGIV